MAKNFEHLIHKNSNVTTNGNPKLPTSGQIEYGEIAVNYATGKETISLKNSNNDIVTFSSDEQINALINKSEKVTAAALNDLNARLIQVNNDVDEIETVAATALDDLDERVNAIQGLPQVSVSDNGKTLMVVDGAWALVNSTVVYSGSGTPSNSQGNNGDIYVQTS